MLWLWFNVSNFQVLLITNPAKQQVAATTPTETPPVTPQQQQPAQYVPQQQQQPVQQLQTAPQQLQPPVQQPAEQLGYKESVQEEEGVLGAEQSAAAPAVPPAAATPQPLTVTAQLVQTPQGPRIILQVKDLLNSYFPTVVP